MKMIGYHGTSTTNQKSIETHGLDPDKTRYNPTHWLGQGVYFFDDFGKALWWANTTSKKNKSLVYAAEINAPEEEILNLDDNNQFTAFVLYCIHVIEEIEPDGEGRYPIFKKSQQQAVFFDYYKEKNNISVIIATFEKKSPKYIKEIENLTQDELRIQKDLMKIIGLGFKEKQICVSNKNRIYKVTLVYDEREEVI